MKPASRYFYHKSAGQNWTIFARFKGKPCPWDSVDIWCYSFSIEPQTIEEERVTLFEGEIACALDTEPSVNEFILAAMTKMNGVFLAFATNHVIVLR